MLDAETKARIDSARDILVGKVPDPKSQVEQITIALIYKFMDDMDRQSEELGGVATFFSGEFKKYAWSRLLDMSLGGHERLALYADGISVMDRNPNIPQLFRDIFKGAFLPYRDPETLNLFLKEINGFTYEHSERLGDAFEYLLSVLGSQGEAGQFRTPRHIIDFIVRIVDPQKHETILDPACGTAGFLVSAYKHILASNSDERPGDKLSGDERARLMDNFCGYDISPDMVRLSRANLYLHGFANPRIYEYDTLTSEDRWDERYDVIMANPPFMSPKGGIRPHNRFSIKARRSEVLFVDYIAEHLHVNGRAGVIVPEGIIFQSQNAYKALRKMLLESYLWCVISLPPGVFNPYSGVRTSILLLDKGLAKRTDEILFVKVAADGFDLGAQRRPIERNDLPEAEQAIAAWKAGQKLESGLTHAVRRQRILESADVSLSGDRYRDNGLRANTKWPMVKLAEVCTSVLSGGTPSTQIAEYWQGNIPWITSADIVSLREVKPRKFITRAAIEVSATNLIPAGNVIVVTRVGLGKLLVNSIDLCISQDSQGLIVNRAVVDPEYLGYILSERVLRFKEQSRGSTIQGVTKSQLIEIEIPLPPLDVQRQIVAELDGYRKIIEGARQVIANYKPTIRLDASWQTVKLGEVCELKPSKSEIRHLDPSTEVTFVPMAAVTEHVPNIVTFETRMLRDVLKGYTYFREGDVLLAKITPCFQNGKCVIARGLVNGIGFGSTEFIVIRPSPDKILPEIIYCFVSREEFVRRGVECMTGSAGQQRVPVDYVAEHRILLPPLDLQRQIVANLEAERALVDANRKLVEIFAQKIQDKLAEIWGEVEETA